MDATGTRDGEAAVLARYADAAREVQPALCCLVGYFDGAARGAFAE